MASWRGHRHAGRGSAAATPAAGHPILAWARRVVPAHAGPVAIALTVPGPGRVILRGTYGKPSRAACRGTTTVTSAREVTVTCRLTRSFGVLLARHGRRIPHEARFASPTGGVEAIARSLELRRWPTHPSSS